MVDIARTEYAKKREMRRRGSEEDFMTVLHSMIVGKEPP